MSKALYLCYFGLHEPLVQTQVLPYMRELVKGGYQMSLLTFEKDLYRNWNAEKLAESKRRLAEDGIDWYCVGYHKWPSAPATLYDILIGTMLVNRLVKKGGIEVIHARVHVPALMGALVKTWNRNRIKLIFDIRGFFPEEYVDAGVWKEDGLLYKTAKRVEKWLFKKSDAFVVLTEKARNILFPESLDKGFDKNDRPIEVIPCCIDLERFEANDDDVRKDWRRKLQIENRFVAVYLGSFGGWYLTDKIIDFFATAKQINKKAFALILTQSNHKEISDLLRERGFLPDDFVIKKVSPDEVPSYLTAADVAVSFIKPCYSKLSSSPTKIAEYLAAGLPIISNTGIGDVDELIECEKIGVLLHRLDRESYIQAIGKAEKIIEETNFNERCKEVAGRKFDLGKVAGESYRRIYGRLLDE